MQDIKSGLTGDITVTDKFVIKSIKITPDLIEIINNTVETWSKASKDARNQWNEILIINELITKSSTIIVPDTKIFVVPKYNNVSQQSVKENLKNILDNINSTDTDSAIASIQTKINVTSFDNFLADVQKNGNNKWHSIYILSKRMWGNMVDLISTIMDSSNSEVKKRLFLKDVIMLLMEKVRELNIMGIYHGDLKLNNILISDISRIQKKSISIGSVNYTTSIFGGDVYLTDFEWSYSLFKIRGYHAQPMEFLSEDENKDDIRPIVPMLNSKEKKYNLGNWYKGLNDKAVTVNNFKRSRFIALDVFYFAFFILYTIDKRVVIEDSYIQLALHFVLSRFRMLSINEEYDRKREGTIDYSAISAESFAEYCKTNIV